VQFLAVYVREAHPVEGWRMASNDRVGVTFSQPRSQAERTSVAARCCTTLEITMPLLVDTMDDRVNHTYSGMPDRLYVIGRDGRVAYKGGRGPFGFKPGEMEQSLVMLLLDEESAAKKVGGLTVPSDAVAWQRLPRAEKGAGQPLPAWARALASTLPRTTAALLELDFLHRGKSPLEPLLCGKLRWVAARAHGCAYAEAQAEADMRRAGLDETGLTALAGDQAGLPAGERAALAFARKLAVAAHTITDDEMAGLLKLHGEKRVVAMVLLLAYANSQDRLLLSLGLPVETDGSLPPLEVRFARATSVTSPARRAPQNLEVPVEEIRIADLDWEPVDFSTLQQGLEQQRARQARIRVPSWDKVRSQLPQGAATARPLRIRWSLVCLVYQPELAQGWSACMRAFQAEAAQDRVFEESLFWVITRSLRCFY
jgi:alkylhydroperoxidase family enzyme